MTTELSPQVLTKFGSTDGTATYEIRRSVRDGIVYCTCPGWRFSRANGQAKTCKHLTAWVVAVQIASAA
jgi:hypothetical protein